MPDPAKDTKTTTDRIQLFDNIQSSVVIPLHHPLIEHGIHYFNKAGYVGPI